MDGGMNVASAGAPEQSADPHWAPEVDAWQLVAHIACTGAMHFQISLRQAGRVLSVDASASLSVRCKERRAHHRSIT